MGSGSRPVGNLPAELNTFINRRAELAEVGRLLTSTRLVTLTGVAGVGKTRLALKVGESRRRAFPDGVWLAELAHLRDDVLLVHTVANELGIHDAAGDPLQSLIQFLRGRRLLLILDNCEHLVDQCAKLAEALLPQVPQVRLLATSREALGVTDEHEYVVLPLATSDGAGAGGATGGGHAVTLFEQRAAAVVPTFRVDEANRREVEAVCQWLDGIPLAIELAAVRLRALSVRQLHTRLDDRFGILNRGARTSLPHQRTLRTAVDWSYELCDPAERRLWALASVFAGGCDAEGLEEVCAPLGGGDATDVPAVLDRLAAKSILARQRGDGMVSYRLLETLREYGCGRLADSGDEATVRRAHAERYLRLAEQAEREWFGPGQVTWLRRLRREHANFRAALEYFLLQDAPQAALRLAGALWFHWHLSGRLAEGRLWLARALTAGPQQTPARAAALCAQAFLVSSNGDLPEADRLATEARDLAARLGDCVTEATALTRLAAIPAYLGDTATARRQVTRALAGFAAGGAGDVAHAVLARNLLAGIRREEGDLAGARELCREALAICGAKDDAVLISAPLLTLARTEWDAGHHAAVDECLRELLRRQEVVLVPPLLAPAVELLAWNSRGPGEAGGARRAAMLLGAADAVWRSYGLVRLRDTWIFRLPHEECVAAVTRQLGDAGFQAAFRRGAGLDLGGVRALVDGFEPGRSVPGTPEGPARHDPLAPLTRRERQVAELVAEGLSNQQIASRLVISRRTAEAHVARILAKLGFTSRAQIAAELAAGGRRTAEQGVPHGR